MSVLEMMRREVAERYTSRETRAAYRAGMSTAAAMCDQKAFEVRRDNPGRRKGYASSVGEFGAGIAKACGDAIWDARAEISAGGEK